jgi:hypothetical protein
MQTTELLSSALTYAARGWRVFPCHTPNGDRCSCGNRVCGNPGKHPRFDVADLDNGVLSATTDILLIQRWWGRWPDANIGLACGEESGFFVLDIDPRNDGEEGLAKLIRENRPLPSSVMALTGGGGQHHLFDYPGWNVPNRTGKNAIVPGVEVKGDGGYIIAPPSLHASGRNYEWEASSDPDEVVIEAAPAWLLELLEEKRSAPASAIDALISDGTRNDTLASLAGSMRRRGMDVEAINAALQITNERRCVPPLEHEEVRRIAESVCRYKPYEATEWRVGAKGDAFTGLDPLRKIGSDPPRYEATVRGSKLELTLIELAEFKRFKLACIAKLNFVPVLPPPVDNEKTPLQIRWENEFLIPALERSVSDNLFEEAPEDASAFGAAWQSILLFLKAAKSSDARDDLFDDKLVRAEGHYIFRGRVLRKWLAFNNLDGLKADELWAVVRNHGGKSAAVRTSKGVVKAWQLPFVTEEEGVR